MAAKQQASKKQAQAPKSVVPTPASLVEVLKVPKKPKGPPKVAKGTARAKRREGLVRNWRTVKGAKQMLPPATATTQTVNAAQ